MPSRPKPNAVLSLEVSAAVGKRFVAYTSKHLHNAHNLLKPALTELSVALVNDATIARLHEQFMSIAGPTDVLTFELDHDQAGDVTAGEVVVCVPYALREAKRRGTEPRNEVLLYALHGMLHLCGFDDRTDTDFRAMHRREDDILRQLGIGAVFETVAAKPRHAAGARGAKKRRGS